MMEYTASHGKKTLSVFSLVFAVFVSGCASTTNSYYWGHYEDLIYEMYNSPGKSKPAVQIEKLNGDLLVAQSKGRPVPPGLYAHLGFMYAAVGDMLRAEEAFNEEKTLFPESAVLIDGMLDRARQTSVNNLTNEI